MALQLEVDVINFLLLMFKVFEFGLGTKKLGSLNSGYRSMVSYFCMNRAHARSR